MTETSSSSNKRIAKNTMMLYIRMLLTMAVSLYTSRIVLNTLGVEDFGIYNVVGGFVTMFAFLNSAMSSATQRFLAFEIGRKDFAQLRNVFSMSINIHFIIALVILLLAETVGLWFVNTQLIIPAERMVAARWVYQFSVVTMMVNVVSVPYNALIIAHERMTVYAWVSIFEVTLKLIVVFILSYLAYDKLKVYAVLMFIVPVVLRIIYGVYSKKNFEESRFKFIWNKELFKSLFGFTGWSLFGNLSWTLMGQGLNIVLNLFFGPTVNAARGVAFQVNGAVMSFVNNFRQAINPQVIKSYSSGDRHRMDYLVFNGAKYSFYLLLLLTMPVLMETKFLMGIWLKNIPDYAVLFTQLVLINSLIQSFDGSFGIVFQAMGKIKENHIMSSLLYLLVLPISYMFLHNGYQPQVVFYIQIVMTILVAFGVKFYLMRKIAGMLTRNYFRLLIIPVVKVTIISLLFPLVLKHYLPTGTLNSIFIMFFALISTSIVIFFIGLSSNIKRRLIVIVKNKIKQ